MIFNRSIAIICVFSISLFFVNSITFYADIVFETYEKFWVDQSDYGETETETESNIPISIEEEEKQQVYFTHIGHSILNQKLIIDFYYIQNEWASFKPKVFTPPPEFA